MPAAPRALFTLFLSKNPARNYVWVSHQSWAQKHNQGDQKLKINIGLRPWVERHLDPSGPIMPMCSLQELRPGQGSGVEVWGPPQE